MGDLIHNTEDTLIGVLKFMNADKGAVLGMLKKAPNTKGESASVSYGKPGIDQYLPIKNNANKWRSSDSAIEAVQAFGRCVGALRAFLYCDDRIDETIENVEYCPDDDEDQDDGDDAISVEDDSNEEWSAKLGG